MTDKKLNGELEEFSYALGMSIAANLIQTGVKTIDPTIFLDGFTDVFKGNHPKIHPEDANQILESFITGINQNKGDKNLEEGVIFLTENRNAAGVVELPSGLQYSILKQGDGKKPSAQNQVKCHYHGTLIDGTIFDSSVQRGKPAVFPVSGVIQGWVEALQLMPVGSKWRLFIPPHLAYGKQGAGSVIGPDTTLIFDVELLEII